MAVGTRPGDHGVTYTFETVGDLIEALQAYPADAPICGVSCGCCFTGFEVQRCGDVHTGKALHRSAEADPCPGAHIW